MAHLGFWTWRTTGKAQGRVIGRAGGLMTRRGAVPERNASNRAWQTFVSTPFLRRKNKTLRGTAPADSAVTPGQNRHRRLSLRLSISGPLPNSLHFDHWRRHRTAKEWETGHAQYVIEGVVGSISTQLRDGTTSKTCADSRNERYGGS